MKKIKQLLLILNIASVAIVGAIAFASCQKDKFIDEPGYLVPKTVDEDPSLPSISVNGTKLHSEAFGNPNDPMVVFLHGGPGSDYNNGLNVKQLVNDNYYVVFFDQRGSGLSKRHDADSYNVQVLFDDLTAVIDYYRTSPAQKVFLFGHSWGGILAGGYINEYPNSVQGAIFAEAGGFTNEELAEYGSLTRTLELFAEATNDVLYYDQFLTGKENEHEILDYKLGIASSYVYSTDNIEGIEGPSPFWRHGAVMLNAMADIANTQGYDFTRNLDQFVPEVLFLYSENNGAYGAEFAQKEADYFTNSSIAEIKDTGHEMIYEKWGNVYPPVIEYLNSLR